VWWGSGEIIHRSGFGGQQEASDGGGVLEGGAGDLGGVDDAGGDEVFVGVGGGVVAVAEGFAFADATDDDGAIDASVVGDLANGFFEGAAEDADTEGFFLVDLNGVEGLAGAEEATPPPGRMPSSTAARVAWRASSTRAFFSFISTSVAAPT
jgi:hypothetical protein